MKVLYGVQGTGQGHISRARAMAQALREWPLDVTWLFPAAPVRRSSTWSCSETSSTATVSLSPPARASFTTHAPRWTTTYPVFWAKSRDLKLDGYDLIISDYEPVIARAAAKQGRKLVGIGHQYAFGTATPRAGTNWLQEKIMSSFAPVDVPIGLHWHPYADNVLPPILDLPELPVENGEHMVVYLPFEDQGLVTEVLRHFPQQKFMQYSSALSDSDHGNVSRRKADATGFKAHLASCSGVICNSGFELISECLQWRKPVLTKPLDGQMEQHSTLWRCNS